MFDWLKRKFIAARTDQTVAPSLPNGAATEDDTSSESNACKARGDRYFEKRLWVDAAACYRQAIAINPSYAEARVNLGNVLREQGLQGDAEGSYKQAIALKPELAAAYYNLGALLQEQGRLAEAIENFDKALERKPDAEIIYRDLCRALFQSGKMEAARKVIVKGIGLNPGFADFHAFLGNLHSHEKEFDKAIACYQRALSIRQDYAEVHINLGRILREQGNLDGAIACFRKAIDIEPEHSAVHCDLGFVFQKQGKLHEAVACYQAALMISPEFTEAHYNLGTALLAQGRLYEAVVSFREALRIRPEYADAACNLGAALREQGKLGEAIVSYQQALRLAEKREYKIGFFQCLAAMNFTQEIPDIRPLVVRALSEPWGPPYDIVKPVLSLIKLNENIYTCIEHAARAWPARLSGKELYGSSSLAVIAEDSLLKCLLENTHNSHWDMERFLTQSRFAMLEAVTLEDYPGLNRDAASVHQEEFILEFYCALAQQCFIVEYIFDYTSEEYRQARLLWDQTAAAQKSGLPIAALRLVAVAAYFPLFSLPAAETLLNLSWPECVEALLIQQIREPMEELQLRDDIPSLTAIEGEVSMLVQRQYEENPYPRWVKFPSVEQAVCVDDFLRKQFPFVAFRPLGKSDEVDILIAGCGTGQHPISTAQQFRGSRLLAVDLSLSSLSYAKRKTREMRLENIAYAQADIMKLGTINRQFDVIESVGVLHHLADPMAGWRILLSLLRPGGFMCLGFYSELARQEVVAARRFIAAQGYASTAEDIRRCRQDLMSGENSRQFRQLSLSPDFYGMSACRDLIFHVQEHRYTPSQLKENLAELHLDFLGFTLDADIARRYGERFPDDRLKTNLDYWNAFESENPFVGMYELWVQKRE